MQNTYETNTLIIKTDWLIDEFCHWLEVYKRDNLAKSFCIGRCSALASVYDVATTGNDTLHKVIRQIQNRGLRN